MAQGFPVIVVNKGGIPILAVSNSYAPLMTVSTNRNGLPVTLVTQNAPAFVLRNADGTAFNPNPELIVNGYFPFSIDGWINSSTAPGNISWDNGTMRLERVAASSARTDQMVTLPQASVPYRLIFQTDTTGLGRQVGTTQGGADIVAGAGATAGSNTIEFTPTVTTIWVRFTITGVDKAVRLDNVSLKRI